RLYDVCISASRSLGLSRSLANSETTAYRAYFVEKPWQNDVFTQCPLLANADMGQIRRNRLPVSAADDLRRGPRHRPPQTWPSFTIGECPLLADTEIPISTRNVRYWVRHT